MGIHSSSQEFFHNRKISKRNMQLLNLCALLPMVYSAPMGDVEVAGNGLKTMIKNWYDTSVAVAEAERTEMDTKYIQLYDNHYGVLYDVCYRLAEFDGAMKDKSKLKNFLKKKVQLIRAIIAAWEQMMKVSAKNDVNVLKTEASAARFAAAVQAKLEAAQAHAAKVQMNHDNKSQISGNKNTNVAAKKQDKSDKVARKDADDEIVNTLKENRQNLVQTNAENIEVLKENKIKAKEAQAARNAASRAAKLLAKAKKACANKGLAYPC